MSSSSVIPKWFEGLLDPVEEGLNKYVSRHLEKALAERLEEINAKVKPTRSRPITYFLRYNPDDPATYLPPAELTVWVALRKNLADHDFFFGDNQRERLKEVCMSETLEEYHLALVRFIRLEMEGFMRSQQLHKLHKLHLDWSDLSGNYWEIAEHEAKRIWDHKKKNGHTDDNVYRFFRDTLGMKRENKLHHDVQRINQDQILQLPHMQAGPKLSAAV